MTMSDFEAAARQAASRLGCTDVNTFLVGAQWSLDQCIALETAINTNTPSEREVEAAARSIGFSDTALDWERLAPHQRYSYTLMARSALEAALNAHD